jgi:hypothetical protein
MDGTCSCDAGTVAHYGSKTADSTLDRDQYYANKTVGSTDSFDCTATEFGLIEDQDQTDIACFCSKTDFAFDNAADC